METFSNTSDICQQLLDRYGNSAAPQHRHLCATAAATRSIIQSESLPLTPLSYFAATISTLSDQTRQLDPKAIAAISSFLSIVLPLVPETAIAPDKANEAVEVVVEKINSDALLENASMRALVKSLGVLLGFCDLEDWDSVKLGFNALLNFSIDKRPKVRKCAQDCLLSLFKSFKSSAVIKKASKSVESLLKGQMPMALKTSALKAADGSKVDVMSTPEHQEFAYMLNVLKIIVPHLSVKASTKVLSQLVKLLTLESSAVSMHIFEIIQVMFETSRAEVISHDAENIIKYLASYIALKEKNPLDSVLYAATLLKHAIDKLHAIEMNEWISLLPLVIGSVAGLLSSSEASAALQASIILKELINRHIDEKFVLATKDQVQDDKAICSPKLAAVKSVCEVLDNLLKARVVPNVHLLGVISVLFLTLGEVSGIYMKSIVFKLAEVMNFSSIGASDAENLQKCIGSAVVAIGPKKLLALLPISLNYTDLSCSNTWLIAILKEYTVGSSLEFFMEYFVTLSDSLRRESRKVEKKSETGRDLEACADNCWELLPAFCRLPTDTYQNFGSLAKLLVPFIKDSSMLESIAVSLQVLVNQNKQVLASDDLTGSKLPKMENIPQDLWSKKSYSKKLANKNISALASCCKELLQALIDVFMVLPSDRHESLKDAIGCLASISDSSMIKSIFISSLERLQLIKDFGDCGEQEFHGNSSGDKKETHGTSEEKDAKRCLVLNLASCFVDGAGEDLVNLLFKVTCHALEVMEGVGLPEAYQTLSRVLEKHASFCSSQFVPVMDLLLNLKSPTDITLLKSRFACLRTLLIHAVKENLDEENTKVFLILNEIILALKDSKEEGRKAAYDFLTEINESLRNTSCATSEEPYQKLINMVMGYLTGSSPHIKSGAVSALSVLVYNDSNICLSIPELIPSVLAMLQNKAVEVIKAVLGFVKVLVSSLQAKDLQNFLPDIVNGILPWSSTSRHHFRSKITIIVEIMMRKCGVAVIQTLVPQKNRDFLQSVLENRRGKTSSKKSGTSETESKPSDLSQRGWQSRKHEESTMSPREEGSKGSRKRPRENRQKGFIHSAKEPYKSSDDINSRKLVNRRGDAYNDGQKSRWRVRDKRGSVSEAQSGGKRKMDWAEATKKDKGGSDKPAAKLAKLKRRGKKRLKIEK